MYRLPLSRLYRFSSYRRSVSNVSTTPRNATGAVKSAKNASSEIIRDRQEKNVFIANPHSYFIEEKRAIALP
ncbi:hypothetical protein [Tolypothrix sp. VBCCA 56010]|uniref:hypothetical protein n=1 Tax=Tolypothrix sp. VBCCA 56010 TaxID=3137731 RepID=UPI003D7CD4A4